jgi:hypothetical protein
MNCFTCERNLTAYIDDEVTSEVRREIEMHLDECEACRQEYESHLASWEVAGNMRTEAVPDDLWQAVEAELQAKGGGGTSTEDLALIVRGLASEIRDLKHIVDGLRQDMETAAREAEDRTRAGDSLDIWTQPGVAHRPAAG